MRICLFLRAHVLLILCVSRSTPASRQTFYEFEERGHNYKIYSSAHYILNSNTLNFFIQYIGMHFLCGTQIEMMAINVIAVSRHITMKCHFFFHSVRLFDNTFQLSTHCEFSLALFIMMMATATTATTPKRSTPIKMQKIRFYSYNTTATGIKRQNTQDHRSNDLFVQKYVL